MSSAIIVPPRYAIPSRDQYGPGFRYIQVLQLAEERAPEGFADIADVLTQEELASTAVNFKKAAGLDLETVNSRDSIVELPAQA